MATEKEYDDIIAPMLADVHAKCIELGMAMVARVEWDSEGNAAVVTAPRDDQSVGQWLAWRAAMARGNFDMLAIGCLRNHGPGSSIVLRQFAGNTSD